MEAGGVRSESEVSAIAATFAVGRVLRIEERVGVTLEEFDFLVGVKKVEGLVLPVAGTEAFPAFSVGRGRL
jgi:hypothetical protein